MMRNLARWSAVLMLMVGTGLAGAAERVIARNGVPVISGGVGSDSMEYLKSQESSFNLKLVSTSMDGDYVAGVAITVTNAAGKRVVEYSADGPVFMARLPAGTYTIALTYQGQSQTRRVVVRTDALLTEYARWRSDSRTDTPTPRL